VPEQLSDNDWAKLYKEYEYIKSIELENLFKVIKKALAEILSEVFNE
jgi:hypothetical protein